MKFKKFLPLLVVLAVFALLNIAATVSVTTENLTYAGRVYVVTTTLDSADVDTSWGIDLSTYQHANWTTEPFRYEFVVDASVDRADTVNLGCYIDGTVNNTDWYRVDTLWTLVASGFGDTTLTGTANFNGHKYPKYRVWIYDLAKEGSDTTYSVINRLWAYQRNQ